MGVGTFRSAVLLRLAQYVQDDAFLAGQPIANIRYLVESFSHFKKNSTSLKGCRKLHSFLFSNRIL
jgi:hypothetical protein